jgi:hypothetical protein
VRFKGSGYTEAALSEFVLISGVLNFASFVVAVPTDGLRGIVDMVFKCMGILDSGRLGDFPFTKRPAYDKKLLEDAPPVGLSEQSIREGLDLILYIYTKDLYIESIDYSNLLTFAVETADALTERLEPTCHSIFFILSAVSFEAAAIRSRKLSR